jgi:hypothetical protein
MSQCSMLPQSRASGLLVALQDQFGGKLVAMRSALDERGACLSPAIAMGFSDAYRRAGVILSVLCRIVDGRDSSIDASRISLQLSSLLMELSHYTSITARAVGEQLLRAELPGANGTEWVSPVQQFTTQSIGPLYDSVGTRALKSLASQMPYYAGQLDACVALTQTFQSYAIAAASNYVLKQPQTRTMGGVRAALNISAASWMQLTRDTLREHQVAINTLLGQLRGDAAASAHEAVDSLAFAAFLCVVGLVLTLGMVLLVRYRLRGHALRVKEAALVASSQFARFISHEGAFSEPACGLIPVQLTFARSCRSLFCLPPVPPHPRMFVQAATQPTARCWRLACWQTSWRKTSRPRLLPARRRAKRLRGCGLSWSWWPP